MSAANTTVLVAGNPNAGKTTLFNLLTGARARVGNYPGVTVERRSASLALGGGERCTLVDLPGSYSLTARSMEERVAIDSILASGADAPRAMVIVVDATTLARGVYFATQLLECGVPCVVGLTMMDEARRTGIEIDVAELAERLGCEVIPLVATRGEGRAELVAAIERCLADGKTSEVGLELREPLASDVALVEDAIAAAGMGARGSTVEEKRLRARALWATVSLGGDELSGVPASVRDAVEERRARAAESGRDLDKEIITSRYALADRILDGVVTAKSEAKQSRSSKLDDVLVHPLWGLLIFAAVMFVVFQALFAWAEPFVGWIEAGVDLLKGFAKTNLPEGPFADLVVDGILAGVGNVVVFVPQIALLFIFITILEDSGYLARVAFVIDRLMAKVGLNGKAFVPMLSGFACAIPAVLATRTIESRRDRLLTMLVVPLSSCSARLPVYVLMTSVIFGTDEKIGGVLSKGALALFAMYVLSVVAALVVAFVIGRTVLKGPRPTLVLELPAYRMPRGMNILRATRDRVTRFLVDAGTVILALTIVLWALLNYPKDATSEARFEERRQQTEAAEMEVEEKKDALSALDAEQAGERLRNSAGGRLGRAIEPGLEPLGFDWKIGVGLIGAFAAREVFVSTLGLVYDVSEATEEDAGLHDKLRAAKHPDGRPVFTPLAGVALMVFFVLACQCMSTLAIVRRESGSWKWAGFMFAYMTTLAYVVTLAVYQVGKALGVGLS